VAEGKVRYAYLQFPILGQGSVRAAVAAECAAEQGKFEEYHRELFTAYQRYGANIMAPDGLVQVAGGLGLDKDRFNACVNDSKAFDLVRADYEVASAAGVRSTPSTFINGVMTEGLRDYSYYASRIDAALGKK